ncbi:MAG: chorismate synthase [Bradymonadia bacterium]
MSSTRGHLWRITTFGESHGPALGVIIDGCPPGLTLDLEAIQADLDRRRPGQSKLTTPRKEPDRAEILSGVFEGVTMGTPIAMLIRTQDADSRKYIPLKDLFRPGHADFTYHAKYGRRDWRGGGRSSARETAARVAAAAVARQWLSARFGVEVVAWVDRVGEVTSSVDPASVTREAVEAHPVRCPDPEAAEAMADRIKEIRKARDTIGGTVSAVARGVPAGWGAPIFDRLEADLGKACLSLPACKGFEVGSGFAGTYMLGSAHNDPFVPGDEGQVQTTSNHAGGVLGGISTGMPITLKCAFKPVATHFQPQKTVNVEGEAVDFAATGRHDPCVLPRAVPLVEAAMLLTLADHALRQLALEGGRLEG